MFFRVVLCLIASPLFAEPWFVNRFGETCGHCHVNPSGGGIRSHDKADIQATSEHKVDGGGDLRYLVSKWMHKVEDDEETTWRRFLMAVDLGMRYRPFHEKLQFVYESRFFGIPDDHVFDNTFRSGSTRSFYALVNPLPYKSYIQVGIFRPLFGNPSPDHRLLTQKITSYALQGNTRAQTLRFRAVSVGSSFNELSFKLHWIQENSNYEDDQTKGWALNTSLNFETLGASLSYSYWQHKNKSGHQDQVVRLQSFHAGFFWDPLVIGYEYLGAKRDDRALELRKGDVQSIEAFLKVWQKVYGTLNYALANASSSLEAGKADQWRVGAKGFFYSNFDLSLFFERTRERTSSFAIRDQNVVTQFHFYF